MPAFSDRRFCSAIFLALQKQSSLGSRWLLAISGGLDSMVLLDFASRFAAQKYQTDFVVAHLDHGLRPDSQATASWLEAFCAARNWTFVSTRLNVASLHAQAQQSSLEAVAREARYQWLLETARAQGCDLVLTGHSASDQLETILMRLIRGGISGLTGMAGSRPLQERQLLRPLLAVTRAEIAAYASQHGLDWQEDSSNQDLGFFRNRIRQQFVPWLLEQNPSLEIALAEQAEIWRDEQDWLSEQARQIFSQSVERKQGLELPVAKLLELSPALQRRLIKAILTEHLGSWKLYSHRHIEAIRALAEGPGAKQLLLPGNLHVLKSDKQLIFGQAEPMSGENSPAENELY